MATAPEITRRLDEVVTRFEALANRLDTTYVRREFFDAKVEFLEARIDALGAKVLELEEGRKWLSRLVLGFIVVGVLGTVYTLTGVRLK